MTPSEYMNDEALQPQVVELVERAQLDMQITTAKKYPRDLARVKQKMLSFATMDVDTAMACFYTLPRDGKKIQGPSVRLAEIAVSCFGNIRAATRIIDNDGKTITAQGVCHDLENNVFIGVEVKRRITDRNGKTFSQDMQVTAGNAASAIALRNAVFKVIPGALIKPVYEQAKSVAVGSAATLSDRRNKMLETFAKINVTKEMVLRAVDKTNVENIDLEDLGVLLGLFNAIRDGDTTIDEAFAVHGTGESAEEIKERKLAEVKAKGGTVTEIPKQQPAPETKPEPKPEPKQETKAPEEPAAEAQTETTANMEHSDGFKADDSDLPEVLGGKADEGSAIQEPAHRTTLRELEKSFKEKHRAGGAFADLLGEHGYERIEEVPDANKAKPIITAANEWLERKQQQAANPAPRQSRLPQVK